MSEPKTALTFEEEITAAFMHYVRGVSQQDIAIMMGGVNGGRVNDACRKVSIGLGRPWGSKAKREDWDQMDIEDLPLKAVKIL